MSRGVIRWVATAIFTILILPFIAANIQKYLAMKRWDEFLLNLGPAMPNLDYLIKSSWFFYLLFFSGGIAVALWVMRLWPERNKAVSSPLTLKINKAEYWTQKSRLDVTEELKKMIVDNKLETIASNDIKGDPDIGTVKILSIEYKINGKTLKKSFREGEIVVIP